MMRMFVLLALVGCGSKPDRSIAEPDQVIVRDAVAAARAKVKTYAAQRAAGLRHAFQSLEPGTAPCPIALPALAPLGDDDAPVAKADEDARDVARFHMNVVAAWAMLGAPPPHALKSMEKVEAEVETNGPRFRQIDGQADMLGRILDAHAYPDGWTRDQLLAMARDLPSDDYWGWELDIVAPVYERGTFDASDHFMPGHVVGKALLWSFHDGRVVCAADVDATNQEHIKLRVSRDTKTASHHQRLDDDLRNEAYRAAVAKLTAVR